MMKICKSCSGKERDQWLSSGYDLGYLQDMTCHNSVRMVLVLAKVRHFK